MAGCARSSSGGGLCSNCEKQFHHQNECWSVSFRFRSTSDHYRGNITGWICLRSILNFMRNYIWLNNFDFYIRIIHLRSRSRSLQEKYKIEMSWRRLEINWIWAAKKAEQKKPSPDVLECVYVCQCDKSYIKFRKLLQRHCVLHTLFRGRAARSCVCVWICTRTPNLVFFIWFIWFFRFLSISPGTC